jgi:hypothetical protein
MAMASLRVLPMQRFVDSGLVIEDISMRNASSRSALRQPRRQAERRRVSA